MSIWPPIIWIGLAAFSLGSTAVQHGKPQRPHNIWTSLLALPIAVGLLWWGGFFAPLFGGAQ